MSLLGLASHQLRRAADVIEQIEKLKVELSSTLGSAPSRKGRSRKKRQLSEAGRLAIVAAQKARWAKSKVKSAVKKAARRTLNAAAKAKIAAAARARWAKAKAAGKNSL